MDKIKRLSHCLRLFFQLCCVFCIALMLMWAVYWIRYAPLPISFLGNSHFAFQITQYVIIHKLTLAERLIGFSCELLLLLFYLFVLFSLVRLFRAFERGKIFSRKNVIVIRRIGYTLLAAKLIQPLSEMLQSFALTWHNPPGARMVTMTMNSGDIITAITALMIILISQIMAEAYKLKQEQQYTV